MNSKKLYRLIIPVLIIILLVASAGCLDRPQVSDTCVPVFVSAKYLSAVSEQLNRNSIFVEHYGVAIIDNRAYLISDSRIYDALKENTTQRIAIGAASQPRYAYIAEVCP